MLVLLAKVSNKSKVSWLGVCGGRPAVNRSVEVGPAGTKVFFLYSNIFFVLCQIGRMLGKRPYDPAGSKFCWAYTGGKLGPCRSRTARRTSRFKSLKYQGKRNEGLPSPSIKVESFPIIEPDAVVIIVRLIIFNPDFGFSHLAPRVAEIFDK